ncbi:MAG: twin-arginine translocase TatA/TatE family subunit [Planctomycetota bacterium]|nr:MAG: twin-arginine translocase TatA/TatE family subunit [Planctomycetota bacterium]
MFSPMTVIIIVIAIVLLFGAKKLPELAKAMRLSVDELKKDPKEPKKIEEKAEEKKEEA